MLSLKIKAIIALAVFIVFFALGAALQCNRKRVKSLKEDVKEAQEQLQRAADVATTYKTHHEETENATKSFLEEKAIIDNFVPQHASGDYAECLRIWEALCAPHAGTPGGAGSPGGAAERVPSSPAP